MVDPQRDLAQPTAQRASELDEPFRPGRIVGHDLDRRFWLDTSGHDRYGQPQLGAPL
jgi:hypothetical protein